MTPPGFEPAIPASERPQAYALNSAATRLGFVNLLNPSGNFTYDQVFNIKKFYVVLTLRLCVLYGSQNKQKLLPYKTLRDWFL
jgi:hypothetical protein